MMAYGTLYLHWRIVIGYFVFLIMPAVWPFVWSGIRGKKFVSRHLLHPNEGAWDFVFQQRIRYWMIVHMKDGRRIGGLFGYNSFASSAPANPQIYIEQVWKLDEDGVFESSVDESAGILILEEEMLAVELFNYTET